MTGPSSVPNPETRAEPVASLTPNPSRSTTATLARRLGTADAVMIGLGSMLGAGVFAAFGPAARAAGAGLLIGLGIAAVIAYCNATASAQLAAVYPTSGGTYVYGRERLGHWCGFAAGWGFVIGKTASCAAMALTFAGYAVPGPWWTQRLVAVAAVLALAGLNYLGVARTAALTRVLVTLTLAALAVVIVAIWGGHARTEYLDGWTSSAGGGVHGLLQAAGLLFFAFAGYARIATMGEEVRDPARTIPRAIPAALGIVVAIYLLVGITVLVGAGPTTLAHASAPLTAAVQKAGAAGVTPIVRIGAALASLGSLLALIAGVGRTGLAMARNRDLPGWLGAVHPCRQVPHHAEIAIAVVVSAFVLTADLRGVIGFSSFGVLVYYGIANAAAFTQPRDQRRWPRALNLLGVLGCTALVVSLPMPAVIAGLTMFAIGLSGRLLITTRRTRSEHPPLAQP